MVTWVLYLCIGVVIGAVAGFYFGRLDDFGSKQKSQLQQKLVNTEQELQDYKQQVKKHFVETSTLINSLTDSYQAVHEHLAKGVSTLCNSEIEVNRLEVIQKTALLKSPQTPQTSRITGQTQNKTGVPTQADSGSLNAEEFEESQESPAPKIPPTRTEPVIMESMAVVSDTDGDHADLQDSVVVQKEPEQPSAKVSEKESRDSSGKHTVH